MRKFRLEVSEFAPFEARAFEGTVCRAGLRPAGCVHNAINNRDYESLDSLVDRMRSDNVVPGTSDAWEISCKACGVTASLDILETADTKFDTELGGYTQSSRSVLSKSGARRRIEEAREEMERVAVLFGLTNRAIIEATWLFNKFHDAGSSKGGRGHKTTAVAALHIASRNDSSPIPVATLCKAHAEEPRPKVVNRFIKQAREDKLIDLIPPSAEAIVARVLAKMDSQNEDVNRIAQEMCVAPLSNVPPKNQAASAIYLAAKRVDFESRTEERKYSGVNISKYAFVERRQIYSYARRMQQIFGLVEVKDNPPDTPVISAANVKLLRRIRKR